MKLAGVMIGTEDAKSLGAFYTKFLGEAGWQQDDWYGFNVNGGTLMIGPHSDVHGKSAEPARLMINLECEDVKADFEKVRDAGATVVAEPYQPDATASPGVWLATLADPDGNYLQLSSPWTE